MTAPSTIKIVKPGPPANGYLFRRFGSRVTMTIHNRRTGRVVMWIGGRWLPVNGPAIWVLITACLGAGVLGGIIARA